MTKDFMGVVAAVTVAAAAIGASGLVTSGLGGDDYTVLARTEMAGLTGGGCGQCKDEAASGKACTDAHPGQWEHAGETYKCKKCDEGDDKARQCKDEAGKTCQMTGQLCCGYYADTNYYENEDCDGQPSAYDYHNCKIPTAEGDPCTE